LSAKPDFGKTKLEVGGNVHGLYDLGQGTFCSDPIYVPRVPGTDSEEDDGYLIFFLHDENTRYQILYIYDYDMMKILVFLKIFPPNRVSLNYNTTGNHSCTS